MDCTKLVPVGATGVSRRDFLKVCTAAAAAVGLPASAAEKMAEDVAAGKKPSVIWLHFQECTGCTESLLRTTHPDVGELILDLVSLDYHETLFAAAGHQIEEALEQAMKQGAGKYILVVEGAVPLKDGGIYCQIGGKNAVDILKACADKAGAIIAIGSCASWGGIPSASPNPTGASGTPEVLKGRTVVTLPGCPANPYNLLGTALQYVTFGTLPALDDKGRPKFAYARVIHDDCPRRTHFDAGRFAQKYGDEAHRNGFCLYKLGCKGPQTHANCSLLSFGEVPGAWPIGVGHPCFGCTEKGIGFEIPLHATVDIGGLGPPATFPSVAREKPAVNPVTAGVGGAVVGAVVGAAYMATRKIGEAEEKEKQP
ncbi:MAG TPA: hydrogenase small subunit [Anaeromyxobacteraceae bacterium]|nr:hydrogenase small subunit [Anaeromyxobacteraceae bacterium]